MRKLRVNELREGMVVADDIFDQNTGVSIPVIRRGVVLTKEYIQGLQNRQFGWVYVELPEAYQGAAGETIELKHITKDVSFEGKISVLCDIPENIKVEAGESLIVKGSVGQGSFLTSRTGAVSLQGKVKGTSQDPVRIVSHQQFAAAKDIAGADIKSSGEVSVAGHIIDSSIVARGDIVGEYAVIRSQLYSQSRIRIRECGDQQLGPCLLVVKPFECLTASQELLKADARLLELQKEMESLRGVVELLRKIGSGIERLPQEKKLEFAQGVKRFKETERELTSTLNRKADLKKSITDMLTLKKIFIADTIYPAVKIAIENHACVIHKQERGIAFSVREGKVIASPFSGAVTG